MFPSCVAEEGKASIQLDHLDVSEGQEQLLAEMVETLIPATDTAGAKELGLHLFTLKMLDDCYEQQDQLAFMEGMTSFEKLSKQQQGKPYMKCDLQQRQQLIATVNAGNAPADVLAFYKILKEQTIKGYLNSELVMTRLRIYELIPSRYNGYHPINTGAIV